jgi:hypothetical protein
MTKPPCPAKAVLRKFNGAGAVDGDQAGGGAARAGTAADGDRAGAGAAQAGTAADGVGAKAGACPLASDMDLDTPVGATEAGVMAVVAVVAVAAMASAAAGKLNLTW